MFKHAVTQEAAYHSLLIERRQKFHLRVGQAVEELFADRIEEFYALLAHHYEAAGETERAVEYLTKAADKARIQESLVEAKNLLKRLLELHKQSGNKDLEARTWLKLALVHQVNFEFGQAHLLYEKAFAAAQDLRPDAVQVSSELDEEAVLRLPLLHSQLDAVNLDDIGTMLDEILRRDVQAGLVLIDRELNLVPHAARSWEVLDDGRKYLFHLREDVRWSDGSPVVAQDYVRYLLRLLRKNKNSPFLDAIEGVYAYRQGEKVQIASVGIRALNNQTIEMSLARPSSHFLYRVALSGYPVSATLVEKGDADFWRSDKNLFSGPFMLVSADSDEIRLMRNPHYFGEWRGNLAGIRWIGYENHEDTSLAYLDNEVDVCWYTGYQNIDDPSSHGSLISSPPLMILQAIYLNPNLPPTNRLEFRRALAHAVIRETQLSKRDVPYTPAYGGVVLPGMPGHSPEVGLAEDQDEAKALLRRLEQDPDFEAQDLRAFYHQSTTEPEEDMRAWFEPLGLSIEVHRRPGLLEMGTFSPHLAALGWIADYPDPHSVLVDMMVTYYSELGWQDKGLDEYIRKLMQAIDRKSRMEIVRQFDYYLVQDQVLVIPILYGGVEQYLVKPWVENYLYNALNHPDSTEVTIRTDLKGQ
jgi:ABC-type oligopeptide transport system substrate-binding subunit